MSKESKKSTPKKSRCCSTVCGRGWDVGDFCSLCDKMQSPEDYWKVHRFSKSMAFKVNRRSYEYLFGTKPGKLGDVTAYLDALCIRDNGFTLCCGAPMIQKSFEVVRCCGCGKPIEWSFDDVPLEVKKEGEIVIGHDAPPPEKQLEMEEVIL